MELLSHRASSQGYRMSDVDKLPAWLTCQELLIKMKEALVSEAIRVLHRELEAGRIKLNANWVNTEAPDEELKRDLLLLNKLSAEAPEMLRVQSEYVGAAERAGAADADTVARIEAVKKLSLAVSYISLLMGRARVLEDWLSEIEGKPAGANAYALLSGSLNSDRLETIAFVMESRGVSEGLFSEDESGLLRRLMA